MPITYVNKHTNEVVKIEGFIKSVNANIFRAWPKIPRYENIKYNITEKIDGTNACVIISNGVVLAQSRKRLISPEDDNHGFAAWVRDNEDELRRLGEGHHFGEWWGCGIQRGYGLLKASGKPDRRFSLFCPWVATEIPDCCSIVPEIVCNDIRDALDILNTDGSLASPGYMRPEGLILRDAHYNNVLYKVIIDKFTGER